MSIRTDCLPRGSAAVLVRDSTSKHDIFSEMLNISGYGKLTSKRFKPLPGSGGGGDAPL